MHYDTEKHTHLKHTKLTTLLPAVWREMVAMQRRGTNVVVGSNRAKLGAAELDMASVVKRNKKQITSVLASLSVLAVLLSKPHQISPNLLVKVCPCVDGIQKFPISIHKRSSQCCCRLMSSFASTATAVSRQK